MGDRRKELAYTVAIFLQKLATAAADVLWLVLLAELIEEVISGRAAAGSMEKTAQCVLGLLLLSAWKRMGYSFGRSLTLKLQTMVRFRYQCRMVEKTAKIPYRLLTDYAFCDLKRELQDHIEGGENFVWAIVQKSGNLVLYIVRTLGMSLLLARDSLFLGTLFFLLETSHCLMTALGAEQEDSFAVKCSPERQYLEELALGQRGAGERGLFSYAGYIAERCDREGENVRKARHALQLEYGKTSLAEQTLAMLVCILTEIALAALLAGGRISLGYFIALSMGMVGLIEKNEEGNALRYLQRVKSFAKQWNRFMDLPETEGMGSEDGEDIDRNGEKSGKGNGKREHGEGNGIGENGIRNNGVRKNEVRENGIREFGTLEFRKVSFRYPRTGRYVLHDLNLQLTKGGYYAFVGANGSGKTTVVKLLSGLYDNYEGEILLDGIEQRKLPFQERRRIFAILFQDAARYEDTIAQNILPGSPEEENAVSVKRRLAEELVREWETGGSGRFSRGADTFLGGLETDGVMLSAGEWQQLLIARELAQPAQIRVLDEPMASLDIFRQGRVYEQITQDAGNCMTILCSHHMAAVRRAKRIFVLKEGAIVEEGSHGRLMEENGLYAKLYGTQRETRRD